MGSLSRSLAYEDRTEIKAILGDPQRVAEVIKCCVLLKTEHPEHFAIKGLALEGVRDNCPP